MALVVHARPKRRDWALRSTDWSLQTLLEKEPWTLNMNLLSKKKNLKKQKNFKNALKILIFSKMLP